MLAKITRLITVLLYYCGAIYGLYYLGECALVTGDCGVIAGLEPVVRVENCLLAHLCDSTPCRNGFGVVLLLDLYCSLRVPRMIPTILEFVVFFCVLRSTSLPLSGAHSKCAALTRSIETVSTLPLMRIFKILSLL